MKEVFARLNSFFSLTKQERTVVIFLVVSLLVGNSVLFLKRRRRYFAKEIVTSERLALDELIEKSNSLRKAGREYLQMDINVATVEELVLLPGIGRATARKIIDYRNRFGLFSTPEDIMKVKGIGRRKYHNIRESITVKVENSPGD